MRKTLAIFLIAVGSICLFGAPASANHNGGSVTICHRTNSDQNPYVVITPDEAAVDGETTAKGDHYLEHQGLVWNDALKNQHIEWGDIIPPVPGHHDGLNWTVEGQAIYNNGCASAPPMTTTTVPATTTTTTTATVPEPITTTVGQDPATTTTVPTTVVEGPTTTVPDAELLSTVIVTRSVPHDGELPVTGANTVWLVTLGLVLLLAGTVLAVRYR
jgi:LPXTG-motif cell wall-anchored protein